MVNQHVCLLTPPHTPHIYSLVVSVWLKSRIGNVVKLCSPLYIAGLRNSGFYVHVTLLILITLPTCYSIPFLNFSLTSKTLLPCSLELTIHYLHNMSSNSSLNTHSLLALKSRLFLKDFVSLSAFNQ